MEKSIIQPAGVFASFRAKAWPVEYAVTLDVRNIVGGTPSDPGVGEAFIRSKLAGSEDLIRDLVAKIMSERGVDAETAAKEADQLRHLNGFKREPGRGLYIEGRQVKASLKESANIAAASGKIPLKSWGLTRKGLLGFIAEHVCVFDDRVYLGTEQPDEVAQKFVHTWRGSGIQYEEIVHAARLRFRLLTDWPFTEEHWAMILLTGEQQGIGASRSQGFGRYTVTQFDTVRDELPAALRRKAARGPVEPHAEASDDEVALPDGAAS